MSTHLCSSGSRHHFLHIVAMAVCRNLSPDIECSTEHRTQLWLPLCDSNGGLETRVEMFLNGGFNFMYNLYVAT